MMRTLQVLNPQDCQPREAQEFPKTLTCATGGRPVLSEALGFSLRLGLLEWSRMDWMRLTSPDPEKCCPNVDFCTRTISQKTPVLRYSRHRNSPGVSPEIKILGIQRWMPRLPPPSSRPQSGFHHSFWWSSPKKLWKIGRIIRAC